MNAAQIADQAIAKIEAEEAGIIPPAGEEENKGTDDKGTGDDDKNKAPAQGADDDKKGESKTGEDDKDKPGDSDDDKPGEFTGEDAIEVEDKTPKQNSAPRDTSGIVLSADEQKYIADNIGEPIIIRGMRGDKEVEIKAYSPADIPADFKFANDQQLVAAQTGFYNLEQKANQLLGNYRQDQSNKTAADFERRENEGIQYDLIELQKSGDFPKFKVRPGDPKFADDPAAKQMQEVLDIMGKRNDLYLQQYNQGRPYKHIGFAEAFDIWKGQNPQTQAKKQADDDQKKEDAERKKTAERSDSNRGMSTSNIVKPTVRSGTTTRDILARIDAEF